MKSMMMISSNGCKLVTPLDRIREAFFMAHTTGNLVAYLAVELIFR